ncbi:helix-turn-helix domain-containing protein [Paractinoplanes deccanensis]|nr:hypothetical protein [Actinoplanes deccanensis]
MTAPRHRVLQDIPLRDQLRIARNLPPPEECRRIREAAGVSVEQLASSVPVQAATLRRWERRERQPQFRHRVAWSQRIAELREFLTASNNLARQPTTGLLVRK